MCGLISRRCVMRPSPAAGPGGLNRKRAASEYAKVERSKRFEAAIDAYNRAYGSQGVIHLAEEDTDGEGSQW